VDTRLLKGRAAEAFVENVFRHAGYKVCRVGRESHVQQILKNGKSDFLPDFLVWRPADHPAEGPPLHRLLCIEVKYRADVDEFLRLYFDASALAQASEDWPEVYLVLVTDHPQPGRSCFQLLDPRQSTRGLPPTTVDLHLVDHLGIWKKTVEEYEELVRRVFSLLGAPVERRDETTARKPPVKLPSQARA